MTKEAPIRDVDSNAMNNVLAANKRLRDQNEALVGVLGAFLDVFGAWERKPNPAGHPDWSGTYLSPAGKVVPTEIAELARAALAGAKESHA